jgi:hypothetical protein
MWWIQGDASRHRLVRNRLPNAWRAGALPPAVYHCQVGRIAADDFGQRSGQALSARTGE